MKTVIHMVKPQLDGGPGSGPQAGGSKPGQTQGQKMFGRRKDQLETRAKRKKEGKPEKRKEENLAGRRRDLKSRLGL